MSLVLAGIWTFISEFFIGPLWDLIKGLYKNSGRYAGPIEVDSLQHRIDFVSDKFELKEVYDIRNSIFGSSQLSGYSYNHLLEHCPFSLRLLRDNENKAMGYYGICRIDGDTLNKFQMGDLTHKEVIKKAIPIEANMDKCYLYIVGIVTKGGFKVFNKKRNEIASFLICDMIKYISLFVKSNNFKELKITGYPSTKRGDNLFSSFDLAFKKTRVIIGKKPIQRVYLFNLKRLANLQKLIKKYKSREVYKLYQKEVISKGWDDLKPMLV